MNQLLFISIAVAIIFIVIKFIEMRIMGEKMPLRTVVKDSVFAAASAAAAMFVISKIKLFTNANLFVEQKVFTDSPDF